MTILHVDTGRQMRGGQHQVRFLMEGLRDRGHRCLLLARPLSPLGKLSAEAGFPVHPARLNEIWRLSAAVDLLHAHDARAHLLAALASRKRFVVSRRVGFPINSGWMSRWKYRRACRFLAVSRFVSHMLEVARVDSRRVDVVFDAVPLPAGLVAWNSANPVVAPAFAHDRQKLSLLASEACKAAGVELRFSENLPRDLPQASLLLYLSASEGLGSAALLAMAAGVPVVASRVGGMAELFEDDLSGLYVNPGPEEDMVQQTMRAILRLRQNRDLACRLIANARSRVERYFSVPAMVEATLASYRRALAG